MPLELVAAADAEMVDAAAFYERKQKMLGSRFLASVQDAFTRIRINPFQYQVLHGDVRRCVLRIFPYGIIFRVVENKIVVFSVMHLHRDPEYWKERP
ncbi:type II toxin-antitoxin system RelE/ParE family toxin [Geomonas sp. Red276]